MLLAGEYPGAKRHVEAKDKISRLVDCGIRQIINLMEPHETDHSGKPFKEYEEIVSQIAARKNASVDCFRFPVADLSVPTVSQMKQILAAINTSVIRELATDLFDHFYAKK